MIDKSIRNRIIGILIFCAVVAIAIWWGMRSFHFLDSALHPRPTQAPVTDIRQGIRVTCEAIDARLSFDGRTVTLDAIISIERLDGRDWQYDPLLRTTLICGGSPYKEMYWPAMSGSFRQGSRLPFRTPLGGGRASPDPKPRRYIYRFVGLPPVWKDATFHVTLVREIPKPDFDLGNVELFTPRIIPAPTVTARRGTLAKLYAMPDETLPPDPEVSFIRSIGLREGLPTTLFAGKTMLDLPTYGHMVVRTEEGWEVPGVQVYARKANRMGMPPGAFYQVHLPAHGKPPARRVHVRFISTDAMLGDSIQFVLPHVTTIHSGK